MEREQQLDPAVLEASTVIDHDHPAIQELQARLAGQATSEEQLVQLIFEYVRDNIHHSLDHGDEEVTCVASDVLSRGTGLCYAKSHLAAALYRGSGIPAGFAYQRLQRAEGPVLHGLVSIHQRGSWRRLDVRGTKPGLPADYLPAADVLAYQGEWVEDLPEFLPRPASSVLRALSIHAPLSLVPLPAGTD